MASLGRQFILLLWKNFVLQKRKVCVSVFEILFPLFFATLLVLIRLAGERTSITHSTTYPDVSLQPPYDRHKRLVFTPDTTLTRNLCQSIINSINREYTVTGYSTEDDLLAVYQRDTNVTIAVVFYGENYDGTRLPQNIEYSLRVDSYSEWNTAETYGLSQQPGPRPESSQYVYGGFLFIQYILDKTIIEQFNGSVNFSKDFDMRLKRMPYPAYIEDPLASMLQSYLPLFIVLSLLLNALQISKNIAYEKEKMLKESMKMMGLSNAIYWLSWFVKSLIYLAVAMLFYTLLLSIKFTEKGKVLSYTDPTLFYVFLFCYSLSVIAFSFMISTFFKKGITAASCTGILFFLTFCVFYFLDGYYSTMTQSQKLAACLLSNIAMAFGVKAIAIYEGIGSGAQWSNFHEPGVVDDNFTLLLAIIMLLVDTALYMIVAMYVDNIHPGEFGVAQPFYFPFLPSYWCSKMIDKRVCSNDDRGYDPEYFERDQTYTKRGISIKNLTKEFGSGENKTLAVNDFTLNMYEGQITSLLGHNGAGKTTIMSMLTGFISPTSGTAIVNGYDIRTNIFKVRENLGMCPQHNILFDSMTVEEHLKFFALLKGSSWGDVNKEVKKMLTVLRLQAKRDAQSHTLSGGQKRKLSVGISLIAGSKVIILDEPTSGMDPSARRQLWDILQQFRQDRTIIFTTHSMDEADILSDRIAIMTEGVIRCCGTSMFLKKLYGAGYHMIIEKHPSCDVEALTQLIQTHVPMATLESQISAELSYLLPFDESPKFANLFETVEVSMEKLGVNSFGISPTTMEEVFFKVGKEADEKKALHNPTLKDLQFSFKNDMQKMDGKNGSSSNKLTTSNSTVEGHRNSDSVGVSLGDIHASVSINFNKDLAKNKGFWLFLQQQRAMVVKKMVHTLRNKTVIFFQLFLPVVFTALALSIEKFQPTSRDEPPLKLDLSPFGRTVVTYGDGNNGSVFENSLITNYKNNLQGQDATYFNYTKFQNVDNFFLSQINRIGIGTFNQKYIIGANVLTDSSVVDGMTKTIAQVLYNGQPIHGIAVALAKTMDSLLKYYTDEKHSISTINHPFPKRISQENTNYNQSLFVVDLTGFLVGLFLILGMAFTLSTFIISLIKERANGSKHLQIVCGVGYIPFWFGNFIWDFVNYLMSVIVILIVFAAFQTTAYITNNNLGIVFLTLVLFGWSQLPFVYMFNFAFKTAASGIVFGSIVNIILGVAALVSTYILRFVNSDVNDIVEWCCLAFIPLYNVGEAIKNIHVNYVYREYCAQKSYESVCQDSCKGIACFKYQDSYLAWESPGIGRLLLFMFLQGFFYFSLVFLFEYGMNLRLTCHVRNSIPTRAGYQIVSNHDAIDNDVEAEKDRINETPISSLLQTDSLVIKNLTKYYGNFRAVNNISVGITTDECFGLLGQNGAGKTTTFKILTGYEKLTVGEAYLQGCSVNNNIREVHKKLGYCPQFDGLIDQMTGRETLTMFGRLRGVSEGQISDVVTELIDVMMLREHADKQTAFYSGGNKRKLSIAIALIGDPQFIFLDEPTTGVDPSARRQIWNVLSQIRASGRTIILTSHSMEECEALCTKIVIMVNAEFVCFGSTQHLKTKFGQGFSLLCRMKTTTEGEPVPMKPLIDFIQQHFPSAHVFDDKQGYIHFQIPDQNTRLGHIFARMEQSKESFGVDDYSVHQTSLEQIFLAFTRNQVPPVNENRGFWTNLKCPCCR
ncbi:hypothetical protein CHS0354_030992 [Potamilus streckersoni]|uniref:ABC transporter domain-containing protein n=1 Tax=Potamilus streckersoni TaxID=2493646 RepID=A0AAE0SEU6_9BIVA|nr:hypothetical protein CHS0354_030992 [Potamilus streckersoni]